MTSKLFLQFSQENKINLRTLFPYQSGFFLRLEVKRTLVELVVDSGVVGLSLADSAEQLEKGRIVVLHHHLTNQEPVSAEL